MTPYARSIAYQPSATLSASGSINRSPQWLRLVMASSRTTQWHGDVILCTEALYICKNSIHFNVEAGFMCWASPHNILEDICMLGRELVSSMIYATSTLSSLVHQQVAAAAAPAGLWR
jgi:hypothetical protein